MIGVVFLLYDIVYIPLQLFDIPPHFFTDLMLWGSLLFWALDIPSNFLVGFPRDGVTEMKIPVIARRYCSTWFPFDVCIVTTDILLTAGEATAKRSSSVFRGVRVARVLRTLRIMRLLKLPGTLSKLQENIHSEYASAALGIVKLVSMILIVNHFIACCWYGLATIESDSLNPNWVQINGMVDSPTSYLYTTSLHWSLTQFTPAAMEIHANTVRERIFSIVVILFALVTFSSFVSSITNAMTHLRNMNSETSRQFILLQKYFRLNNISLRLCVKIRRHLDHQLHKAQELVKQEDVKLFAHLSEPLHIQLHYEVFSPALRAHPLFERIDKESPLCMNRICHKTIEIFTLFRGDTLFSRGDRCSRMYFIHAGGLKYEHNQNEQDVLEGDWLSEAVLWAPWLHHGDARAETECTLMALDAKRFHEAVGHNKAARAGPSQYAHLFVDVVNNLDVALLTDFRHPSFDISRAVNISWLETVCNQDLEQALSEFGSESESGSPRGSSMGWNFMRRSGSSPTKSSVQSNQVEFSEIRQSASR